MKLGAPHTFVLRSRRIVKEMKRRLYLSAGRQTHIRTHIYTETCEQTHKHEKKTHIQTHADAKTDRREMKERHQLSGTGGRGRTELQEIDGMMEKWKHERSGRGREPFSWST